MGDLERSATNEANQDLNGNFCLENSDTIQPQQKRRTDGSDGQEVPILQHTLENIQLSVQAATIKRVGDLREHKRVEDQRLNNRIIVLLHRRVVRMMKPKNSRTKEMEDKDDDDLIYRLPDDLLEHVDSE